MRMRTTFTCVLLLMLGLATSVAADEAITRGADRCGGDAATNAGAGGCSSAAHVPATLTFSSSGDWRRDRFAEIGLRYGNWEFQNINWVRPDRQSAFILLFAGRKFRVNRRLSLTLLAGPWYSYENHAWNELVVDTNLTWQGERFRARIVNHWGAGVGSGGYSFDAHTQTFSGIQHLPSWLGLSLQEERTRSGLVRMFAGPYLSRQKGRITLTAYPYRDITRHRMDMRLGLSYSHNLR